MSVQQVRPSRWLHDDSAEDLVGADWHQCAIRALSDSLDDLAAARHPTWHVGDQLTLVGAKPDGTVWRPSPDIMIHPQAGPAKRAELVVRTDGAPALVIEVASPSTGEYDADTQEGKAGGYLQPWGAQRPDLRSAGRSVGEAVSGVATAGWGRPGLASGGRWALPCARVGHLIPAGG